MTPEEYIHKLMELSQQKLAGINEILDLTKQQAEIICEDNLEELNRLIGLKQLQIDSIDELDNAFEVYYSRLKSLLGVQSLEEIKMSQLPGAAELKQTVARIFSTAREIQRLEIDNKRKVEEALNKLAKEIRTVRQSKMVNNGYNTAAQLPKPSYFIDTKK